MKKLLYYFFGALVLFAWSACQKDTPALPLETDDEALVAAIVANTQKEAVAAVDLPAESRSYLLENHFDTYVETAALARGLGYEVRLATEENVYFGLTGRLLRHRGPQRNGPCVGLQGGRLISLDSLAPAIADYIAVHYPDHEIGRVKVRGDKIIVLIRGHKLLIFNRNGSFVEEVYFWYDCRPCLPAAAVDLPPDVVALVESIYPGAEIHRVCRRGDWYVLGVSTASGRGLLVFDTNWNFLFSQP